MTSNHEIQSNDPRNDDKSSRTRHPNHANPSRPSKSTIPTPGRDDIQPERTTNEQDDAIQKKNIKVGSHVEPMIGDNTGILMSIGFKLIDSLCNPFTWGALFWGHRQ